MGISGKFGSLDVVAVDAIEEAAEVEVKIEPSDDEVDDVVVFSNDDRSSLDFVGFVGADNNADKTEDEDGEEEDDEVDAGEDSSFKTDNGSEGDDMGEISFGDNESILSTPESVSIGLT